MKILKLIIPIIGMSIGGALYHVYASVNETHPIESFVRNTSAERVHRGEVISITSDVVRNKEGCNSTVRRIWLDSNGNELYGDDVERPRLPAGKENYYVALHIPTNVNNGVLRLRTTIEFYCNPVQKFFRVGSTLELPDIFFEVVPGEAKNHAELSE
jgi:hypothetical protein